jgi:RNA polymerase sigma-70 factor (ECF subfamily)
MACLYESHVQELRRFARRRVGRDEAEDVVQDAYLHLLQKERFEALDHPKAFLYRIAANLTVDSLRKHKTRSSHALSEIALQGAAQSANAPDARVEIRRLLAVLGELPPLCREAFFLNRLDGFTHAEIAERLNLSVRTIDRYIDRASTHLKRRVKHCATI